MRRPMAFAVLSLLTALVDAEGDACSINRCQCSMSSQAPHNDVSCFVTSITGNDTTITALPANVQALKLSCSSLLSPSILHPGIFQKFTLLRSLTIEQCNMKVLTAESLRGLSSLSKLFLSENVLPVLDNDTFKHLSNLQSLTIVFCNLSLLPDIARLKALQYFNVSHNGLRHVEVEISGTSGEADDTSQSDKLIHLKTVDLSYNNISSLPLSFITLIPHVENLYLTGLSLTQLVIPDNLELNNLMILDAKENPLQAVDFSSLGAASNIKKLLLEGSGIPLNFTGLSHLITIEELSLNNFAATDCIWQELNSTLLVRLNLSINNLTNIDVSRLPTMRLLILAKNRISHLSNTTFFNQPDLLLVNMSENSLQALPAHVFQNNLNLKALDLGSNNLSSFEYNHFAGLHQLFYLNLSKNIIVYFLYTVFKDMASMQYLYLNDNRLRDLPKLSYMTELLVLDISNNQLSVLRPGDFSRLEKLESLFVNDNRLTIIAPNLLSDCPAVLQVYFHNNQISYLGTLGDHPNIRILTLDNNLLTDFPTESPLLHLRNLQYLFLSDNNFTTITNNMFPPSLLILFLNNNNITNIYSTAFRKLPLLTFVSLTGNKNVLYIPLSAVNVFKNYSPKPVFNIEKNVLWCTCETSYLKVISEEMNSNPVFSIYYPRFLGLENTKCYLPYEEGNIMPFNGVALSQFVCDYDETWCDVFCECCSQAVCECVLSCPSECRCIYGGSGFTKMFINIYCREKNLARVPIGLPSRTVVLYLDGNKFCNLSKQDLGQLRKTEVIYLNSSGVQSIENGAFDSIPNLNTLYLNDNFLTSICENLFGNTNSVQHIYLHNNLIDSISPAAFSALSYVQTVTLHNNQLMFLNAVPKIPHPLSLTLSGNPWSCNCDVSKVIMRTVYEINEFISDIDKMCCYVYDGSYLNHVSAHEGTPAKSNWKERTTNSCTAQSDGSDDTTSNEGYPLVSSNFSGDCLSLLHFNYEDHCTPEAANVTFSTSSSTSDIHPGFIALIIITIILLLLASTVLFVMIKRQEIQAWVFVKFGVRFLDKKAHLDKEDAGLRVFDAFISYSSKDEEFVAADLLPRLETGGRKYRLCVHYRDFPVGRNITDTIYRAIENSSRTILLLSVNFLSSEWCRFEFQTAHHYILREGSHKLIIVLFEDIPEQMLDPDLKVHLKSRTYLKFGDPWFWEKLYFALPTVKDRQDRSNDRRNDILQGMRILAGEEEAGEETNLQRQRHDQEIQQEVTVQEDLNGGLHQQDQTEGNEPDSEDGAWDKHRKYAHVNNGFF